MLHAWPVSVTRLFKLAQERKCIFCVQDHYRAVTGLPVSTYFSAFKWTWLHENVAVVREAKAEGRCMLGTIDSWLIYNLTGGVEGECFPPHWIAWLHCRMNLHRPLVALFLRVPGALLQQYC